MTFTTLLDAYKFSELWDNLSDGSKIAYRKPLERLSALYKEWASSSAPYVEVRSPMQLPVAVALPRSLPTQAEWNRLVRSLPVSNAEKNKTFIVLNAVYQGAELGRMKFVALSHTVEETEPYTKEEIEKLWASPLPFQLKLAVAFLRFCFYSGMRPWCEAAAMRKDALAGELVLVMGSKRREKGKVARVLKMLPEMQQSLDFAAQCVPCSGVSDLVWVSESGRALNKDTVRAHLAKACSLSGVQHREMYDARRGLATAMLRQGYSIQHVANQLGHKSTSTTERYNQMSMAEKAVQFKGV